MSAAVSKPESRVTVSKPQSPTPESDSAEPSYRDIPGTYVFDGARCQRGYVLNMFCMSLTQESNRDAFRSNPSDYLDQWDLTPDQRESIEKRQWLRMLELGGNVYYTFKLAAFDGMTFRHLAAGMTGVTIEEFAEMMTTGGRPIEGNRSRAAQRAPEGNESPSHG